MTIRKIIQYPNDEILRYKSKTVEKIDSRILSLLQDMSDTMYSVKGVGLAAPQIGAGYRVIVIDVQKTGLIKLINPVIKESNGERPKLEGCLSIPQVYGKVIRPEKILVKAADENGKIFEIQYEGIPAQILSHEIDHLNGVLFIDKMIAGSKTDRRHLISKNRNGEYIKKAPLIL